MPWITFMMLYMSSTHAPCEKLCTCNVCINELGDLPHLFYHDFTYFHNRYLNWEVEGFNPIISFSYQIRLPLQKENWEEPKQKQNRNRVEISNLNKLPNINKIVSSNKDGPTPKSITYNGKIIENHIPDSIRGGKQIFFYLSVQYHFPFHFYFPMK